ncbi:DNA translocase FtsK [Antarcticimicrobium sediminis]|uniref:DNA translocase FtsK n=1 Tax=Antarcticimicrobium sediminis TaxID=2546227 RepID=A0A4R5ENH1_9RHOB|nr:DNA translocase FtsK [Antarcticimicrobium sediminis]TDE36000.1 DNA translocase FtsK [Antarcticimicrobium sediminis]
MAFQSRSRDPLLDSNMQALIEKRGRELIGIALICLGLAAAAMIGSYTPDDPNWMVSTDAPVQNWLGRLGASIAAPLFMVVGEGSWGIALVLVAWGLRYALHYGDERAMSRLIFAPIAVALGAVYAATLVPGAQWHATHSFGLGGLFGDTVMGALLTLLPMGSHFAVKLMSLITALSMLALGAYVLGFTRPEVTRVLRFAMIGVVMVYGAIVTLVGRGAGAAAQAARERQALRAERREAERQAQAAYEAELALQEAAEPVIEAPELVAHAAPVAEERSSFLSRMPALIRRPEPMPEPELVEPEWAAPDQAMPGDDRIRAKISDAIRARARTGFVAKPVADPTRPLTKGRGRGPTPLVLDRVGDTSLPPEPPVTGPQAGLPPELPLTAPISAPISTSISATFGSVAAPIAAPTSASAMPILRGTSNAYSVQSEPYQATAQDMMPELADDDDLMPAPMSEPSAPMQAATIAPVPQARPVLPQVPVAEPRKVVQNIPRKVAVPSRRAQEEVQPALAFDETEVEFELPPLGLLTNPSNEDCMYLSDEALEENARMLENVLDDYGVKGEIVSVRPGPVVTMYELEPAPGLKASRVIGLADDIARSMSALSARVSTVPGRSVIGIELPNETREKVVLREILSSRDFGDSKMSLPLALGKDIGGGSVVANLAKMPHLLIAGTTGSGKSVAINTMILSLLYKLTPEECRLIMIDPKMLELSVYDGIPHLLSPVVTDPKKAVVALKWTVGEMEDRYRKMSKTGVRNIEGYNGRVREALAKGEMFSRTVQTGFDDDTGEPVFETEEFQPVALPYIVVIVDEMADLMMVAGKEIEACIQRLAQMARASGIHLIMATQRPSVDVITGTIKANFPTRISFQVTSKVDSRTILGEQGAEQLLGMGDMLYMAGGAKITRCHGPFVSDEEVEEVVTHLKQFGPPDYVNKVLDGHDDEKADNIDAVLGLSTGGNTDVEDALYDTAVQIVIKDRKCSTSYIQRKLAIGYNKAARLVEQMEDEGLVSPANHVGKREILVPEQN